METKLIWRKLQEDEAKLLSRETRNFPDLGFVSIKRWLNFNKLPIMEIDNRFAGTIGFYDLPHWIKLGPFVILKKYQGKGLGKSLFKNVVNKFNGRNLYIGSSHPAVWKLARQEGFQTSTNFFSLPWEIQFFLIFYFITRLDAEYLKDSFKKLMSYKGRQYKYFLKR